MDVHYLPASEGRVRDSEVVHPWTTEPDKVTCETCLERLAYFREPGPCARCGRTPATGYASYWSAKTGELWLCHGDDDESPTCYEQGPS